MLLPSKAASSTDESDNYEKVVVITNLDFLHNIGEDSTETLNEPNQETVVIPNLDFLYEISTGLPESAEQPDKQVMISNLDGSDKETAETFSEPNQQSLFPNFNFLYDIDKKFTD